MIGGINLYLSVKDFASVMFARKEEHYFHLTLQPTFNYYPTTIGQ